MIKESSYFEGNVKSLGFDNDQGTQSVGVMLAGTYTFSTGAPERMTVISGAISVKFIDNDGIVEYRAGESFEVAGDSSFDVTIAQPTAYLCEYLAK